MTEDRGLEATAGLENSAKNPRPLYGEQLKESKTKKNPTTLQWSGFEQIAGSIILLRLPLHSGRIRRTFLARFVPPRISLQMDRD